MEVSAYHSVREGELHYHNNNECSSGNLIPLHDLAPGTGDKLLCPTCAQLNRAQGGAGN
jgi:hypothetical protein